ncbi:hypothetical protein RB195_005188 [Necator americanus]|uniref:Uncharacterized protein n=1 Tax=Necator americanus TaxID=51031 RepID=A0ABR1BLN0_NECAM
MHQRECECTGGTFTGIYDPPDPNWTRTGKIHEYLRQKHKVRLKIKSWQNVPHADFSKVLVLYVQSWKKFCWARNFKSPSVKCTCNTGCNIRMQGLEYTRKLVGKKKQQKRETISKQHVLIL